MPRRKNRNRPKGRKRQSRLRKKSKSTIKKPIHPFVKWLRGISVTGLVLGGAGLLMPDYFWAAVACVYVSACLIAVDLWFEPELRSRRFWRFGGLLSIVGLTVIFSFTVVFVSAPLLVEGYVLKGDHPVGTNISGITWPAKASELRFEITNPSKKDYANLDFTITSEMVIADAVQTGNLPNLSIMAEENNLGFKVPSSVSVNENGHQKLISTFPHKAWSKIYRIRCDKLPRNSELSLMLAVVPVLNWQKPMLMPDDRRPFTIMEENSRAPQWVELMGQYQSGLRIRDLHVRIEPVPVKTPLRLPP